jgi:HEAT repeat protein
MIALVLLAFVGQDNVRELVEKLGSESLEEREEALEKLKKIGKPALPDLEKAAKGQDPEVVERAKYLLRFIPIQGKVPARLLRLMPDLVERFVLDDPHSWTDLLVAAMNRAMTHRIDHPEDLFRPGDLDGIVPLAFRGIRDKQDKDWICSAVVHLKLKSAAPEVVKLLDDPIPEVRGCALETLKAIGSPLGYRRLLRDPDPNVQAQSCERLAELRDPSAVPDIAAVLASDSAFARGHAAWALARLGAVEYAKRIGDVLEDKDSTARFYAVHAVAELAARGETPRVRALLRDPDPSVRAEAIGTLAILEGRDALPALRELMDDRVPLVQGALVATLAHLGAREAVPLLLDGEGLDLLNGVRRPEAWSRLRSLRIKEPVEGTIAELRVRLQKQSGMKIEWPDPSPDEKRWFTSTLRLERGRDPLLLTDAMQYLVSDGLGMIVEADRIRFMPAADAKKFWQDWWAAEPKK